MADDVGQALLDGPHLAGFGFVPGEGVGELVADDVEGERIYGRGTADNKGPLLVHITAVARLLEKNPDLQIGRAHV